MRLVGHQALAERKMPGGRHGIGNLRLGDPESYFKMVMHLVAGRYGNQRTFRQLAELQYTRNDMDFQRGTYRVRGDVIDIFPADSDRACVRLELFDEEIESISWFRSSDRCGSGKSAADHHFPQEPLCHSRDVLLGA